MQPNDLWATALDELQLQMTQATFDTWLHDSTLASLQDNLFTIAVKDCYAKDWLESRLLTTIKRTLARLHQGPVDVAFTIAYPEGSETMQTTSTTRAAHAGEIPPGELDRDMPPECRYSVELVHFDPREMGHVRISNYAAQYWQPYLHAIERDHRCRCTGCSFDLWLTLKSFPAHYATRSRPQWPTIQTLADIVTNGNRHKILGRCQRKDRPAVVGAIEILENHRIVWLSSRGAGRQVEYAFRVLDRLPLLTPPQVDRLSPRLQERHKNDLLSCELNLQEWEQLTLPMLTHEEQP